MKFIISLLIAITSSLSLAASEQPTPEPSYPVFAKGRIKMVIAENKLVKEGNSYKMEKKTLCTKEMPVTVWDFRGGIQGTSFPVDWSICEYTHGNTYAPFFSSISIAVYKGSLFDGGPTEDLLGLSLLVNVEDKVYGRLPAITVVSRDLNAKSLIQSTAQIPNECKGKNCPPFLFALIEYTAE